MLGGITPVLDFPFAGVISFQDDNSVGHTNDLESFTTVRSHIDDERCKQTEFNNTGDADNSGLSLI